MARIIVYDGREHPDPDPAVTIDEVKDIMSTWYPDMANATYKTEKRGTDTLYIFRKTVGTKGASAHETLAELVLQTPPAELEILRIYDGIADPHGLVNHDKLLELYSQPTGHETMERAVTEANRYTAAVGHLTANLARLAH